mgnify:CR=1 FL=1
MNKKIISELIHLMYGLFGGDGGGVFLSFSFLFSKFSNLFSSEVATSYISFYFLFYFDD